MYAVNAMLWQNQHSFEYFLADEKFGNRKGHKETQRHDGHEDFNYETY